MADLINGKLNFKNVFFHGLFFFGAKNSEQLEKMVLESILKNGEISSKDRLKSFLSKREFEEIMYAKNYKFNWNGEHRVSVARDENFPYDIENHLLKYVVYSDHAFSLFCTNNISVILTGKLLWDVLPMPTCHCYNRYATLLMDGEYQFENFISKESFIGIGLPYSLSYQNMVGIINNNDDPYNHVISNLINLPEEEFVSQYFKKQMMVEDLLKKYDYNIGLYNTNTGNKLQPSEEEIPKILDLKKKIKK